MKHTIITILLCSFISSQAAIAQISGELIYKKVIDDKATSLPRIENYAVYFNNEKSLEILRPIGHSTNPEATSKGDVFEVIMPIGKKGYFILKDFKAKSMNLASNIEFKYYLVTDSLENFKWMITSEKKQILKFNCTKATTSFRGRKYEAWFTDDVALRNGPWKFSGLPGLIVSVYDTEKIYTFELASINFGTFEKEKLEIPEAYLKDEPITHHEFLVRYNKKVIDLEIESRASTVAKDGVSSSSKSTIPPLIEKY